MARSDEGFDCHVHRDLVSFEIHHVWPTQFHGPDIPANRVKLCCNAHSDVHDLLRKMLAGKEYDLREYGRSVREIARRGYDEVMAYGEWLAAGL